MPEFTKHVLLCAALLLPSAVANTLAGEAEAEPQLAVAGITAELASSVLDELVPEVEALRGLTFKRPVPVAVIDDDEAQAHLIKRLEAFDLPVRLQSTQRAYALLGLLPGDVDIMQAYLEVLRDQAGGFYDPESGSFFLLDDAPALLVRALMAHELTHALEDQTYDLDARLRAIIDNDDRVFAAGAVHEGSAMLLMSAYLVQQVMQGKLDAANLNALSELDMGTSKALEELPPVLARQLWGPYVLGLTFLARGNLLSAMAGGYPQEDAGSVFAQGPLSSEQILHPEKYWDAEQLDEPVDLQPSTAGQVLGRRWKLQGYGVLGELSLGLLVGAETPADPQTAMLRGAAGWTNAAATGWDGDRWELWSRGKSALVLLSTVWDSPLDAQEFEEALTADASFEFRRSGEWVVVVAGGPRGKRAALLEEILSELPAADED